MSTKPKLRLNFNERSDFISPLEESNPFTSSLWQYPDREPLEQQLADNFQLSPSQVICTNGGDEAIMILMRLIKETGKVILPLPAFSQYNWGIESWQLDAEIIPSNEDLTIDIDALIDSINKSSITSNTDEATNILVTIITRPNNPSGELISLDSLVQLIETSAKNNAWVFLDEAYIEFSDETSVAHTLLKRFDNLVVLRTLSKAYGLAGIRLGYLLGSEKLIAEFSKRCAPFNIAQPTIEIATLALANENKADVKDYCQTIINNRNNLYQWLLKKKINVLPSQANFLVLQLPQNQAIAVESFLERKQVLVRMFDDKMSNCLRITIPYRLENLKVMLEQALAPSLICFDMDGVLIDTSDSYDATVIATVEKISKTSNIAKTPVTKEEIQQLRATGGYNNDWVVAQKLLETRGVNCDLTSVTEAFQELYLGTDGTNGLVQNEKAMINQSMVDLITQSKTTFSIVTGRPQAEAQAGQQLVGLKELDLISLDSVTDAKPSPEGIEKLQKKYSNLSWMVGDNPDDMQAAIASHSLAIGISKTNKDVLYQAGADIVLNDINELENWLCPMK